jgi:hypothetical protein
VPPLSPSNERANLSHIYARFVCCSGIVRNFGRLLEKNKLLLVELLFLHNPAQSFCETLHNVYEAKRSASVSYSCV